jgi:hypothetical protein
MEKFPLFLYYATRVGSFSSILIWTENQLLD